MDQIQNLLERYPVLCPQEAAIRKAGELLCQAARQGRQVLTCGNGGSAADAEHVVGELMKDFHRKRPIPEEMRRRLEAVGAGELAEDLQQAVRAICLNSQTALLTALMNDGDPAMVFAQQVYGYGREGDVLLGFSTSGNSRNVYHAVQVARALGVRTIVISGASGGKIAPLADAAICVPETDTYKVQELTLPIYHALCLQVEDALLA